MGTWRRRTGAAIRTGLTWAAAWAFGGFVLARVPGFYSDLPFAFIFAPLGFLAGAAFSVLLMVFEGRRSFEQMSIARFAGLGALGGVLLSSVFVIDAVLWGGPLWGAFLKLGPVVAAASAACASGSLALARRADAQALAEPADDAEPRALG